MKYIFICELPKAEQLKYFKRIKAALIAEGVYTSENVKQAMQNKIKDIEAILSEYENR